MEELSLCHSQSLRTAHPDRVPIVLISDDQLKNTKLLINTDFTVAKLMVYIRSKNVLNKYQAYYLFVDNMLLSHSENIGTLYFQKCRGNGFLYITVKKENTFG